MNIARGGAAEQTKVPFDSLSNEALIVVSRMTLSANVIIGM